MSKKAIGFIDSGVGGLTVVKQAMNSFPMNPFIIWGIPPDAPMDQGPKKK